MAERGDTVSVVDKDPRAFERLGARFLGHTVEGIAFDRDVLEQAGVARADALVAVTGGDNSNIVAARVARDTYKVPRVIARIQDPRRAAIYEELGITTVATVGWTLGKIRDYLEHAPLKEEATFGRGEVALVPQATTVLAEGDVVRLAVQGDARGRLDELLGEEARR